MGKKHCAKNMCRSCYHQKGNSKMATKCIHDDKPNYAKGMCKNCYLSYYYLKRLKQKRAANKIQKLDKKTAVKNTKKQEQEMT